MIARDDMPAEGELHRLSAADLVTAREAYRALLAQPRNDAALRVHAHTRTVRIERGGVVVTLYAQAPRRAADALLDTIAPDAINEGFWRVDDGRALKRFLAINE